MPMSLSIGLKKGKNMSMLIICEKPSVARDIANALGAKKRGEGYLEGNELIITWCIGHLVGLSPMDDYGEELKRWSMYALPFVPSEFKFSVMGSTKKQFQIVKKLLNDKKVSQVVNATDAGREGELIFDNVYTMAKSKKPVLRMWNKSLTKEAILESMRRLRPDSEYVNLKNAARCRAKADWIIGLNSTRAQTLVGRKKGANTLFSVGRVQTPTLAMIVEREREIKNFKVKRFFQIEALLQGKNGDHDFKALYQSENGGKFPAKELADAKIGFIKDRTAYVKKITKKEVKTFPERFYDLTTLQREANKRFGFSAKKTLDIAQSLYEKHKAISYPRTDSRYIGSEEEKILPDVLKKFNNYEGIQDFVNKCEFQKLSKKYVDDTKVTDHHGIIPTGQAHEDFTKDEGEIFEMIVRRSLAIYFPEKIESKTEAILKIGEEKFIAKGSVLEQTGWSEVEGITQKKDAILPKMFEGANFTVKEITPKEGKTKPPERFTEGSLLKAMENAGKKFEEEELEEVKDIGLGTPATRAGIIETLKKRNYIEAVKKSLRPTETGEKLIDMIPQDTLKSPELTGHWEQQLKKMEKGECSPDSFMDGINGLIEEFVKEWDSEYQSLVNEKSKEFGKCLKCESPRYLKKYGDRFYVTCSNSSCKSNYSSDENGNPLGGFCQKCESPVALTKNGSKICSVCDTWQTTIVKRCDCQEGDLELRKHQGQNYVKCTCCGISYPTDLKGNPTHLCQEKKCSGAVSVFKSGSKKCTKCGKWQNNDVGNSKGRKNKSEMKFVIEG